MPKNPIGLWGPVLLWMGAVFAASARSDVGPAALVPDWATHGAAYAVLAILTCRALGGGFGAPLPSSAAVLAVAFAVAYGVTDELHQSFVPGRDASAADVGKDLGGAVAGALLYRRAVARGARGSAPR
ncbi:MAG: VanZ family protein [Acidobacteria bacterium]|nr:VanZ family protein [Acidobacteriota bacterium]